MPPIISVENLGKKYTLSHERTGGRRYRRLSEELLEAIKKPFRRSSKRATTNGRAALPSSPVSASSNGRGSREEFWALRDVSFEVNQGEVLGIIGRNGAGKSTLLKILSRITEPTVGRARIKGRVASLLEVGTGFHGELTGRENIFLNGAILGMSRTEIRRKFDEIVEFAEVEKFLDTPVKRYSSGMYVRLAFAVAAHLEPEILIVDEVLAVGDAEFQKKCLGKMGDVARGGRTVLFVSHNMVAVQNLCTKGIELREGRIAMEASVADIVLHYIDGVDRLQGVRDLEDVKSRSGTQRAHFTSVHFENLNGDVIDSIPMGSTVDVVMSFRCKEAIRNLFFGFVIADNQGQRLACVQTDDCMGTGVRVGRGAGQARCRIPRLPLTAGVYYLTLAMSTGGEQTDHIVDAASFEAVPADVFGTAHCPSRNGGPFFIDTQWMFKNELPMERTAMERQ
jgi:lipopolysaccharide transport system ATP-binding protein